MIYNSILDILCYDGGFKLFTPEKITENRRDFPSQHPNSGELVTMQITLKRNGRAKDCAALYNTLFKNCSRLLDLKRFKNKYFDHNSALRIPQHKLEIWPGITQNFFLNYIENYLFIIPTLYVFPNSL